MQRELERLQGSWRVISLEMDGQAMPAAMLGGAAIVVDGNRFKSCGMGAEYEGTVELDVSTRPRRLDLIFDTGPEKGNRNLGIYEFKGKRWTLCIATRGTVRPTAFVAKPGSGVALETLVRGEIAPPSPEAAKQAGPATELEGEWAMVSGIMDGKAMDAATLRMVRRVTRGNETTVFAGAQVMMKFEFSIGDSTSPRTMDYLNTAGANKGKKQLAIYRLQGDSLALCVAAPGQRRPEAFESKAGSGTTLTEWKRLGR